MFTYSPHDKIGVEFIKMFKSLHTLDS